MFARESSTRDQMRSPSIAQRGEGGVRGGSGEWRLLPKANRERSVTLDPRIKSRYFSKPSCRIAACTAGRAAMRSRKAAMLAKPVMSTPTRGAQLVTVNR